MRGEMRGRDRPRWVTFDLECHTVLEVVGRDGRSHEDAGGSSAPAIESRREKSQ
jgi:hypothetical protein